eukprot:jgi/Chrpa1/25705/Chrysochromulina_OHIO_Genome00007730-RA
MPWALPWTLPCRWCTERGGSRHAAPPNLATRVGALAAAPLAATLDAGTSPPYMVARHCAAESKPIAPNCMQPAFRILAWRSCRKISTPKGCCRCEPARARAYSSKSSERDSSQQLSAGRHVSKTAAVVSTLSACARGISRSHSRVEFQCEGPRCVIVTGRPSALHSGSAQCGGTPAYQTVSGRVRSTTSYRSDARASRAARLAWHAAKPLHCETARIVCSRCEKKPERKQPRAIAAGWDGPSWEPLASRATPAGWKAHAALQTSAAAWCNGSKRHSF